MTRKFNPSALSPKDLAKHLRQPDGEIGKQIGLEMNKSNLHICINSYKVLAVENNNHILEIGMGNGFYIKDLLKMAENLRYTGIDYSHTMLSEAKEINKKFIAKAQVNLKQASIEALPFPDNTFDCITTTNTIYFWPHPEKNIKELFRVLKTGGKLLLAYRSKSCMDQLELAKHGFEKYESKDVEVLLENAFFKKVHTQIIKEPALEFDQKTFQMNGIYTSAIK